MITLLWTCFEIARAWGVCAYCTSRRNVWKTRTCANLFLAQSCSCDARIRRSRPHDARRRSLSLSRHTHAHVSRVNNNLSLEKRVALRTPLHYTLLPHHIPPRPRTALSENNAGRDWEGGKEELEPGLHSAGSHIRRQSSTSIAGLGPGSARCYLRRDLSYALMTKLDIQYNWLGEEGEAVVRKAVEGRSGFVRLVL